MLKAVGLTAALFIFAGLASAQVPSGNIFFGYSYERTNTYGPNVISSTVTGPNLHGWEASFKGKIVPFLGIVGDVSGHYGSQDFTELTPNGPLTVNVTGHQRYLVGPRLSIPISKFTPFAEPAWLALAVSHTGLPTSDASFIRTAVGGGLDYKIFRPIAVRVEGDSHAQNSSAPRRTIFACRLELFSALLGTGIVTSIRFAHLINLKTKQDLGWLNPVSYRRKNHQTPPDDAEKVKHAERCQHQPPIFSYSTSSSNPESSAKSGNMRISRASFFAEMTIVNSVAFALSITVCLFG